MKTLTHRSFLSKAVVAGLAAPVFGAADGPRFPIGACDWSMGKRGDMGAMALAGEIGLDGVQVSFGAPGDGHDIRDPEVLQQYLALGKQHGTRIGALGMGMLNKIPLKSAPETLGWVSDSIDAAKAAGTKVVLLAFLVQGILKAMPRAPRM